MIESNAIRKLKINLADYDYKKDIRNRLMLADFSCYDMQILEEILYSSIKISISALCQQLSIHMSQALHTLDRLAAMELITIQGDTIYVDKFMRKHFEFYIMKFAKDFHPDLRYFQAILKKVPIHVLPTWYVLPRNSNNIFSSILEKYLMTPSLFERYIEEYHTHHPLLQNIIHEVYHAKDFKVSCQDLCKKYKLLPKELEEYLLYLEYSCLCCVTYQQKGNYWQSFITPYHEWQNYLLFLERTKISPIKDIPDQEKNYLSNFCFIENMTVLLQLAKINPLPLQSNTHIPQLKEEACQLFKEKCINVFFSTNIEYQNFATSLLQKLILLQLGTIKKDIFYIDKVHNWLDLSLEERALYVYRHPLNQLFSNDYVHSEKTIREAEKSIIRVIDEGWIYFDDFIQGVTISLSGQSCIQLKKKGNTWHYEIPHYTEMEENYIKKTIFEWLFEVGITTKICYKNKDYFRVTAFGKKLFAIN